MDYGGILFRIEDVFESNPNQRGKYKDGRTIESWNADKYIANMIRDEVNGSNDRCLYSYSKSLATCLLKYNCSLNNKLHLFIDNALYYNSVYYYGSQGPKTEPYSIINRLYGGGSFINDRSYIKLLSFVIDVADNDLLNLYLQKYTTFGKKQMSSPEKDSEVVVFNPPFDIAIVEHLDAVYVLYALEMRYYFLSKNNGAYDFIKELNNMNSSNLNAYDNEIPALNNVIRYLHDYSKFERELSEKTLYDYWNKEHVSTYFDPILWFWEIMKTPFLDAYNTIVDYVNDRIVAFTLEYFRSKCSGT